MPPKRKLANDTTTEEPAPKRTLRSSKTPQAVVPETTTKSLRTRHQTTTKKPVATTSKSTPKPAPRTSRKNKLKDLDAPSNVFDSVDVLQPSGNEEKGRRHTAKKIVLELKTNDPHESSPTNTPPPTQKSVAKRGKKATVIQPAAHEVSGQPTDVNPSGSEKNSEESQISAVELTRCLVAQKISILNRLHTTVVPPRPAESPEIANDIVLQQLTDLLQGTVERAEGNSCLILGPRGSGKSALLEECLGAKFQDRAIVIRLCGWLQSTDRHALRELAIQLLHQTGTYLLSGLQDGENAPQEDSVEEATAENDAGITGVNLPPSSQLHSLIPVLSSLNRPVVIILDAFDLFALHPRQSLLYCLLDAVQNCRASPENKGIAVIGMSSRIDTIQLLEKRVKSRFSGRTLRTAPPNTLDQWQAFSRHILLPNLDEKAISPEWQSRWAASVDAFLGDENVRDAFHEAHSITRDLSVLRRILVHVVIQLSRTRPFLDFDSLQKAMKLQRRRPSHPNLHLLSYPALCLLVAITHVETSGHSTFTFEMLLEKFQDQVRASSSAPVQLNGGSIGMMRCSREILMSAFEGLVSSKLLLSVNAATSNTPKAFLKHRCVVEREDIKKAIENSGQTNLKKWLTKS